MERNCKHDLEVSPSGKYAMCRNCGYTAKWIDGAWSPPTCDTHGGMWDKMLLLVEQRDALAADAALGRQVRDAAAALGVEPKEAIEWLDFYGGPPSRWQNAIQALLADAMECLPPEDRRDIDGSGCESGDPLDVTLTEIRIAIAAFQDALARLSPAPAEGEGVEG